MGVALLKGGQTPHHLVNVSYPKSERRVLRVSVKRNQQRCTSGILILTLILNMMIKLMAKMYPFIKVTMSYLSLEFKVKLICQIKRKGKKNEKTQSHRIYN